MHRVFSFFFHSSELTRLWAVDVEFDDDDDNVLLRAVLNKEITVALICCDSELLD